MWQMAKCYDMAQIPYVFTQLVQWLPRDKFDRLVGKYHGNVHVKVYSCWNHLLVMIWAQLTGRRSLRDISTSLRAHADKTYRMGMGSHYSRCNIANANAGRSVSIYRELAQAMMHKASAVGCRDNGLGAIAQAFGVGGFFAIDSSTVTLDLGKFPWCVPQEGVGGVKLHTIYDIVKEVPRLCLITGHEERDQTFMGDYPYENGCLYLFDRAYMKTPGLAAVKKAGAFFVVRKKSDILYRTMGKPLRTGAYSDSRIKFTGRWASSGFPWQLRMVSFDMPGKGETMHLLTNNTGIPPEAIALLYKNRWKIETFFKWVKQHLRINSFYGTSANAVMIQIYTAFTAYCMLALVADAVRFNGSLHDFSNLISVSLTEKVWIRDLVDRYDSASARIEQNRQLSLFDNYHFASCGAVLKRKKQVLK